MALWRLAQSLKGKTIGEIILKKALTAPLRQIIENAGKEYSEIIQGLPDKNGIHQPKVYGYNAKDDCYCEMIEAGIIDPTKVERLCIENAISAASTFITTNTLITQINEKK